MDKIVSEVVEELGSDRLNAKELFDKYTKYKAFSSLVVREYTKIKLEISENYRKGGMEICPDLWGNQKIETEQLTEIIIRLLKEDGFYVEQGSYISAARGHVNTILSLGMNVFQLLDMQLTFQNIER